MPSHLYKWGARAPVPYGVGATRAMHIILLVSRVHFIKRSEVLSELEHCNRNSVLTDADNQLINR